MSSPGLEPLGFRRCLEKVHEDYQLTADSITTDACSSVTKLCREMKIEHHIDPWHVLKGVSGKIREVGK